MKKSPLIGEYLTPEVRVCNLTAEIAILEASPASQTAEIENLIDGGEFQW